MQAYGEDEIRAVERCLRLGWLAPGEMSTQFSTKVAASFGKRYGLFVNSGSSANILGLICAGIGPGVEVITPACTFSTTVSPIAQFGAVPRFCDVLPNQFVPSPDEILKYLTPNTKIILVPNLLGNKMDWKTLRMRLTELGRTEIVLVEDSCDTMTYTPESDISTTSFYPSHIMTAGGTGGMVMFNDESYYKRALKMRDWGRVGGTSEDFDDRFHHGLIPELPYDCKFLYGELGYNFKACEMNAAFGLVQFEKLPQFADIRRRLFARYLGNLKGDPFASKYYGFPDGGPSILWLAMPLSCPHRIELLRVLEAADIQTRVAMAGNILRHPIYKEKYPEEAAREFPVADQVMREAFLVGCHHGMNEADVDRVSSVLIDFARAQLGLK
jgi:CDP-6-deoxy-D-xylo-4-hexulose-3-dehydrase